MGNGNNMEYFVCRKIKPKNGESKYINAPWPKKGTIYKILSQNRQLKRVIVVEGPIDTIKASRVGYAAGLLGKKATREQLDEINRYATWNDCVEIFILLDPDAFSFAVKLKMELDVICESRMIVRVGIIPVGKDPGSMNTQEFESVIDNARSR
jgi:DNA primase